ELLATQRVRPQTRPTFRQKLMYPLHQWLDWSAFRHADALVAGCQADIRFALNNGLFNEHTAACVNPGVDGEYLNIPFQPTREHLVVFLGTWSIRKAPDRIVRVMTQVLGREPACRFEIVG